MQWIDFSTPWIDAMDFGHNHIQSYKDAMMNHHLKAKPLGPLNMGEVFSFRLAMKKYLPLFFYSNDFLKTLVKTAMKISGYEMNEKNWALPIDPGPILP